MLKRAKLRRIFDVLSELEPSRPAVRRREALALRAEFRAEQRHHACRYLIAEP